MGEVIEKDLDRHFRYNHNISSANWSRQGNRWTIEAMRAETGEAVVVTAAFLWMCQGYYRKSVWRWHPVERGL